MAADAQFRDEVLARLAPLAGITCRPMFGGFGLFAEGDMFALISGSALFCKVDETNLAAYEEVGSKPYGRMPYYRVPDEVLANNAQTLDWARASIAIAHARAKKR